MATPPTRTQTEQKQEQRRSQAIVSGVLAGVAAKNGVAVPPAAGVAAGTAGLEAVGKLSAEAVGALTVKTTDLLLLFGEQQLAASVQAARSAVARAYPERTAAELEPLVAEEGRRERAFLRKMADRLKRDLPEALKIADREARRAAVQKILERERRYVGLREEAIMDRALARAEMLAVREASPKGAYWQLSPFVRTHTPDCVALAGQFWPWGVIDAVGPPPRHHGCQCQLLTLDEAVARDLMVPEQSNVDKTDAMFRAKKALKDAELLEGALSPEEWRAWLWELCEAAEHSGAMVALFPHPDVAKELAIPGGEAAGDLHVTLKFLGPDHRDLGDKMKGDLKSALSRFAAGERPLEGQVGGPGFFPPNPEHKADEMPVFAKIDVPGLQEFRRRLVSALPAGVPADSFAEFKPHMTLQYVQPSEKPDLPSVGKLPLTFTHACLAMGDERHWFPLGGSKVEEALPQRRYSAGYGHGGEFAPKVGGDPGRLILKGIKRALAAKLAPELPPSGRQRMNRGRTVAIDGRPVHVPEGRMFDRTIAGRRYTSPPFSTRVYRDGRPWEPPAQLGVRKGDLGLPVAARTPEVAAAVEHHDSAADRRVESALASRHPGVPPVEAGDHHATAAEALNRHGFLELEHKGTYAGSSASYLGPDMASRLRVDVGHDGKVASQKWEPASATPPGQLRSEPPKTWEQFAGDVKAFSADVARRHGRPGAHVTAVFAAKPGSKDLSDHAGEHRWNGDTWLGADVQPSILTAAATRARGEKLTDGQRREVWKSYQTAAHEMIHGAMPISRRDALEDPGANALNEALVEELSHVEAAGWLKRGGQGDVAQWRADNPLDPASLGVYVNYRLGLSRALDHAGVAPADREQAVRTLLFDTRARDRVDALARMAAESRGTTRSAEKSKVEKLLTDTKDASGFVPILTPQLAPTAHAARPFEIAGRPVAEGDKVRYSKRVLKRGSEGEWETLDLTGHVQAVAAGDKGWTMTVRRTDGRTDYAVIPGQVKEHTPNADAEAGRRSWGATADHVRVNGMEVRAGSRVSFPTGGGTEGHATVERVLRASNPHDPTAPGWTLEATDKVSGRRIILTDANTRGGLRAEGRETPTATDASGRSLAPRDLMLTVEDRTRLGRHWRLPAGTFAVPAGVLMAARLPSRDELSEARARLRDPLGGGAAGRTAPLVVHPAADGSGRLVVTGGLGALQVAKERGWERLPAVLGPAARIDSRLARARGAVADGLRRAREVTVRGGGAAELAREALGRADSRSRGGFQEGLRQGFHDALPAGAGGVAHPPSLFGWDLGSLVHGKKEPKEPFLEKSAKEWAGSRPKPPAEPVKDDAGLVTLTKPVGGTNGAMFGVDETGQRWVVKTYRSRTVKIDVPGEAPIVTPAGKTRVSSGIVAKDKQGRVLLIQPKGGFGGYEWTFPKGGVDKGEHPRDAAVREVGEETGMKGSLAGGIVGDFLGDTGVTRYYHGSASGKFAPTDETDDAQWVTPAEALKMLNKPRDRDVLRAAFPGAGLGEPEAGAVKTQVEGDAQDRVATELLSNALYRELGVKVPEAGTLSFGGKPAVASPVIEGAPGGGGLRIREPSRQLAKDFMVDAFLGNWDVLGQDHGNVLWPAGTTKETLGADTPGTRLDQGGTLQFRAQGGKKPFGPVPTEVWTMASPVGGQAFGTMAVTDESKVAGAKRVGALTDARIEQMAAAAGFASSKMREEVVDALKARRDWMKMYSRGLVHEPKPLEGDAARDSLTGGQKGLELFPEQEQALKAWGDGWDEQTNAHLRSGRPKEQTSKEVRFLVAELDSLLGHVRTKGDVVGHAALPGSVMPDAGWESLAGRQMTEKGFLGLALDPERAAREGSADLRVTVPSGSKAVYARGVPDLAKEDVPAQPELLLARGARLRVTHVDTSGPRPVVHAVAT